MSVDRDKERVLRLFERHRKTPGAPFDESHFLDYLLARPKRRHAVYNSFTGLRRFNAFIDAVQLEFAVFFSVKDREANYSLQKFVERVGQLKSSPGSSLASLRNSKRRGFGWHTVVLLNVVALLICLVMFRHVPTLALLVAASLAVADIALLRLSWHERAYQQRLQAQLEAMIRRGT